MLTNICRERFNLFTGIACLLLLIILLIDSFHLPSFQDERSFLSNVLFFANYQTIIPFYTQYPTFYSYLIAIPIYTTFIMVYLLKGLPLEGLADPFFREFVFQQNEMVWIWTARGLSMALSIGILYTLMKYSQRHFNNTVAYGAALLLIVDPLGLYHSHARYALPDILVAFLILIVMILCTQYTAHQRLRTYLGAGFLTGLAISSKFNAAVVLLPLLVTPWLSARKDQSLKNGTMVLLVAFAGFFIGSPMLVLAPQYYQTGFTKELMILYQGANDGPAYLNWAWMIVYAWDISPVFTLLAVFSTGYVLTKLTRWDILFLTLLISSVVFLGSLSKKSLAYFLFLYPLFVIQIARMMEASLRYFKSSSLSRMFFVLSLFLLFVLSINPLIRLLEHSRSDNRTYAKQWIHDYVPRDKTIYMDWAYVPILHDKVILTPTQGIRTHNPKLLSIIMDHYKKNPPYKIVGLRTHLNYQLPPMRSDEEYLMTSSYCYDRFLSKDPLRGDQLTREFPDLENFYHRLFQGDDAFRVVKTFSAGSGPVVKIFKRSHP